MIELDGISYLSGYKDGQKTNSNIAEIINYPYGWDLNLFPTLEDAVKEMYCSFREGRHLLRKAQENG